MCQNQKFIIAKVNSQVKLVQSLIKNIRSDFGLIHKIKRLHSPLLKIFGIMESRIFQITTFDDEDAQDCDVESHYSTYFDQKSYSQIIGIEQSETQNIDQNIGQKIDQIQQNLQHNFLALSNIQNSNIKRGPYRSYKTFEKVNVVKMYQEGKTYAYISRYYGIPQKNIVRWCKNGINRKQGAGRKIGDEQMENKVLQWIKNNFQEGDQIESRMIRSKASEFSSKKEFKSSKGWLKNFIRRHDLNERYGVI